MLITKHVIFHTLSWVNYPREMMHLIYYHPKGHLKPSKISAEITLTFCFCSTRKLLAASCWRASELPKSWPAKLFEVESAIAPVVVNWFQFTTTRPTCTATLLVQRWRALICILSVAQPARQGFTSPAASG